MSLAEDFENAYIELRDLIEKGKNFFDEKFEYTIVMDAERQSDNIDKPKIVAKISSPTFLDWENFAFWLDNEEGEMYRIDLYQDGLIIEQDL